MEMTAKSFCIWVKKALVPRWASFLLDPPFYQKFPGIATKYVCFLNHL